MWAQPFLHKMFKIYRMFSDFYIRCEKDKEIPKNDQESGRSDLIGWGKSSLWGESWSWIGEERRETEILYKD